MSTAQREPPAPPPVAPIIIDGRTFRPLTGRSTVEQDYEIMAIVSESGVMRVAAGGGDGSIEEWVMQLVTTLYRGGHIFRMLGAMLEEDGVPWSPATAATNADVFRTVTDPDVKHRVQSAVVALLIGFFMTGVSSRSTSLSSLLAAATGAAPTPPPTPSTSDRTTASASDAKTDAPAASSVLASGTDWFGNSPEPAPPAPLDSVDAH